MARALTAALPALPLQAQTPSNDATLSALTVSDGTNDLTLDPGFVPGTYVYAAEVGDAVDEVTLTATVNDGGAEVRRQPERDRDSRQRFHRRDHGSLARRG